MLAAESTNPILLTALIVALVFLIVAAAGRMIRRYNAVLRERSHETDWGDIPSEQMGL